MMHLGFGVGHRNDPQECFRAQVIYYTSCRILLIITFSLFQSLKF